MLGFLARFLFSSTAIAPVAFVYAYALWINENFEWAFLTIISALVLILAAFIFIAWAQKNVSVSNIKFTGAETADQENVAFLLLYISPLFTAGIDQLNFSISIPVIILFLIVIMSGNNYHFNPLLNILGWHFYKVNTIDNVSRILITRRSIRNVVRDIPIIHLTDYVVMEKIG